MMPDWECVATMAPPRRSTSNARFCGVHVLAGESADGVQVAHVEPGRVTSALGTSCL